MNTFLSITPLYAQLRYLAQIKSLPSTYVAVCSPPVGVGIASNVEAKAEDTRRGDECKRVEVEKGLCDELRLSESMLGYCYSVKSVPSSWMYNVDGRAVSRQCCHHLCHAPQKADQHTPRSLDTSLDTWSSRSPDTRSSKAGSSSLHRNISCWDGFGAGCAVGDPGSRRADRENRGIHATPDPSCPSQHQGGYVPVGARARERRPVVL